METIHIKTAWITRSNVLELKIEYHYITNKTKIISSNIILRTAIIISPLLSSLKSQRQMC